MAGMTNEKVSEMVANANDSAENEKPDLQRIPIGKIARLPKDIRDQLNRRLEDNQPTDIILGWLNALPGVQEILATQFNRAPISPGNLSNWRLGGFQHWLQDQESLAHFKVIKDAASDVSSTGTGELAAAAAAIASSQFFDLLKNTSPGKINPGDLSRTAFAIATLANVEQNTVRLQNEKIRIRQRDDQLLLMRDKHQRDVIAIGLRLLGDARAKEIEAAPIDNSEKIELLGQYTFPDSWKHRPIPDPPEPASPLSNEADPGCQQANTT